MKISLLLLLLLTNLSFAKEHCQRMSEKYGISGKLVPVPENWAEVYYGDMEEVLRRIGPMKFDWIDLEVIRKEIRTVKLCFNNRKENLIGSETRNGSVNLTADRTILFNYARIMEVGESQEYSYLVIHEFLGALGYDDENYQLSTAIFMQVQELLGEVSSQQAADVQKSMADSVRGSQRRTQNIAGGSGVGGGGDPVIGFVKPLVLFDYLTNADHYQTLIKNKLSHQQIISFILNVRIETDEVKKFETISTQLPGIHYSKDPTNRFIILDHRLWPTLRELGDSGAGLRSQYIQNLTVTILALAIGS